MADALQQTMAFLKNSRAGADLSSRPGPEAALQLCSEAGLGTELVLLLTPKSPHVDDFW